MEEEFERLPNVETAGRNPSKPGKPGGSFLSEDVQWQLSI